MDKYLAKLFSECEASFAADQSDELRADWCLRSYGEVRPSETVWSFRGGARGTRGRLTRARFKAAAESLAERLKDRSILGCDGWLEWLRTNRFGFEFNTVGADLDGSVHYSLGSIHRVIEESLLAVKILQVDQEVRRSFETEEEWRERAKKEIAEAKAEHERFIERHPEYRDVPSVAAPTAERVEDESHPARDAEQSPISCDANLGTHSERDRRKKLCDDYVLECKKAGVSVTQKQIVQAANPKWSDRNILGKWIRGTKDWNSPDIGRRFEKVFRDKPHMLKSAA